MGASGGSGSSSPSGGSGIAYKGKVYVSKTKVEIVLFVIIFFISIKFWRELSRIETAQFYNLNYLLTIFLEIT